MRKEFSLDFIGLGATKCATSWVYRCLLEHPDICGPQKKELNFFLTQKRIFEKNDKQPLSSHEEAMGRYEKYFSHCNKKIKGEFSPNYIYDPGTPALIKKYFPDIKLIICLRDPVDRAYSLYWFAKEYLLREKNRTFELAIENNPQAYIDQGMYSRYIENYSNFFPKENIKICFFDDLKHDPVNFIQDIYVFLGVASDFIPPSVKFRENSSRKTKNRFIKVILERMVYFFSKTLRKIHFYFIVDWLREKGIEDSLVHFNQKKNIESFVKPPLNPKTKKRLKKIFKDDMEKLEKMTGRDLSAWIY